MDHAFLFVETALLFYGILSFRYVCLRATMGNFLYKIKKYIAPISRIMRLCWIASAARIGALDQEAVSDSVDLSMPKSMVSG
jgi:hypothetical protein